MEEDQRKVLQQQQAVERRRRQQVVVPQLNRGVPPELQNYRTLIAAFGQQSASLSTALQQSAGRVRGVPTASLVRTLGYGGAIHSFKNYVLRGEAEQGAAAERILQQASEVLAELSRIDGLSAKEEKAVETIDKIVKQYRAHLPTVGQLLRQEKSVEAIDESVIVDDADAINAIATLRGSHEWNEIENLDFHIGYGSGIHNFKNPRCSVGRVPGSDERIAAK